MNGNNSNLRPCSQFTDCFVIWLVELINSGLPRDGAQVLVAGNDRAII